MIPLTVEEIAGCTRGILVNGSPELKVRGIGIDSRNIADGDMFIPLRGRTDGHAYIGDALRNGASGYLVEKGVGDRGKLTGLKGTQYVIEVEDSLKALQDIAAYHRTRLSAKVIGVTGSTGKTTTKDMLNCILTRKLNVVSTDKNYNNEIGVPLTILKADENAKVLVIEMAMRGIGQIKELAEIAKPDVGVVTNIGQAHMELLGSEEMIAQAKAELIEAIPENGVVVLNADDLWTPNISKSARARIVSYGITSGDIRGSEIVVDDLGRASFRLNVYDDAIGYIVRLAVPGRHNVYNALAASTAALQAGLSIDDVRIGIADCRATAMRMEIFATDDNVVILNDAYNANPTSMQAALSTLMDIATEGRHIAVLGDMLELGNISSEAHKQIGEIVASLGVSILVAVGPESQIMADSAVKAGMPPKAVIACENSRTAAQVLKQLVTIGDVVLVKASRGVGLEEAVRAIVKTR